MRADPAGRACVELVRDILASARRWWVIEPTGRLAAGVTAPAGKEPIYEVGVGYIVRRRDADGLDAVALCRLVPRE